MFQVKKPQSTKFSAGAAKPTTPVPTPKAEEKQAAKFKLKVGTKDSGTPPENVCLLWEAKDKKGNTFFKGSHKESGTRFFLMSDKKTKGFRLTCAEEGTEGFKALCPMTEKTDKAGQTFYVGVDNDGQTWLIFFYTPKDKG